MPLQRLAGLFLLAGVGVGLLWPGAARRVRPGPWALLGHLLGTVSGLLIWQIHRWPGSAPDDLTQARAGLSERFWQSLADFGFVLARWLVPLPAAIFSALPLALWVVMLGFLLLLLWPRAGVHAKTSRLLAAVPVVYNRMLFLGLAATIASVAVATALNRCPGGQQDIERYLSALYPPVVVLLLQAWPTAKTWASRLGPSLLAAWLVYVGGRAGHNAQQLRQLPPAKTAIEIRLPR